MSRSTAGAHGVNLMPLLDVLLCTMGTLIVILGVINREARLHPAKRMAGTPAAKAEEMANAREDFELRVSQLTEARDKTREDLQIARTKLSGIEEHSRELSDELRKLSDAAKELEISAAGDAQRESLRRELAEVNSKRLEIEKNLTRARSEAAHRQPAYAVVPFEGMYKTNRRPIYIECRADEVILQPEGIVFSETDFLGPGGPGNPLASALRAAQEYWRAAPKPAPELPNEPYPLLLVRPDGIIAYYLVRDAMTSWDAEFGYELIGQDWKLDFPVQPQPQLKNMETQAVAEARDRLQWLAQTSPELFSRKSTNKTQYHVTPFRGGVARDGGPSLGNDPFEDDPLGGFGRHHAGFGSGGTGDSIGSGGGSPGTNSMAELRGNSAFGSDSSGSGNGNGNGGTNGGMPGGGLGSGPGFHGGSAGGPFGSPVAGQPGGGGGLLDSSSGSGRSGSNGGGSVPGPEVANVGPRYAGQGNGNSGFGGSTGQAANGSNGKFAGGNAGTSGNGSGGAPSSSEYGGVMLPNSAGGSSAANGGAGNSAGASSLAGGSSTGGLESSPYGSPGDAGAGSASADGAAAPGGASSFGGSAASESSSMGQAGGSSNMTSSPGMPSLSMDMSSQSQQEQQEQQQQRSQQSSMARRRGRNWALPNKGLASVPIQRSIRVACWTDRLVLLPDTRDQQAQVIPLPERTDEGVNQLVAAVGTYTKSWGIAGRGMYWRPQLILDVQPNAERRAADLQELLSDSGWDVKRR